jgi:hypothetical protein
LTGINGESSFERALLQRAPNCEIWGYDFSVTGVCVPLPRFNRGPSQTRPNPFPLNQWGPEISDDPELKRRSHFKPWALTGTDNHKESDDPKGWTLDSLMKLNGACSLSSHHSSMRNRFRPYIGHTFIDILKIDIEGGEFDALTSFITSHTQGNLPVGQLQLEIHALHGHERFDYFINWWESLEAAGLRPFWTEPNLVYVNIMRGVGPELTEVCAFAMSCCVKLMCRGDVRCSTRL